MPSTNLDLTAAVDAAAHAGYSAAIKAHQGGDAPLQWHELPDELRRAWREAALPFVVAAAPLIAGAAVDHEAALVPDHDAGTYLTSVALDYYIEAGLYVGPEDEDEEVGA